MFHSLFSLLDWLNNIHIILRIKIHFSKSHALHNFNCINPNTQGFNGHLHTCSFWSNRMLIGVGISFRWSLDNQMRIICQDLYYEEANSPGASMAFQSITRCVAHILIAHLCLGEITIYECPLWFKCQWEKYCSSIWNWKGKTSASASWISFMTFIMKWHSDMTCFFKVYKLLIRS